MKPERPVVVLVFAILNLVFGGITILSFLCGGIVVAFVFAALSRVPGGTPITPLPSGLVTFFIAVFIYGFIMSIVLILSGIGLLNMRPWGRKTAIAYSIVTIAYTIIATVINITYAGPAMHKWQRDLQEEIKRDQQSKGIASRNVYDPSQSSVLDAASSIVGAILGIAYAIALLVVMYLPHVSAAFAGKQIKPRLEWDRDPEYERQE
jgi:hypothetical protein